MFTPRRTAALLCLAVIFLAALIPAGIAVVPIPLIHLGPAIASAGEAHADTAGPSPAVSLRVLFSSRRLARAGLLPTAS